MLILYVEDFSQATLETEKDFVFPLPRCHKIMTQAHKVCSTISWSQTITRKRGKIKEIPRHVSYNSNNAIPKLIKGLV